VGDLRLRPLRSQDADAFADFLESLSAATRARYQPHPLTRAEAHRVCAEIERVADPAWRFAAVDETSAILGYVLADADFSPAEMTRYHGYGLPLDHSVDCRIAPVVADAAQGRGLGCALMAFSIDSLAAAGRRRIILFGGTQADNERAQKMYRRMGFIQVPTPFRENGKLNYDMHRLALPDKPAG